MVDSFCPKRRDFSLRTGCVLLLPVSLKSLLIGCPFLSRLLTAVGTGRSDKGDPVLLLTTDKQRGIDVSTIHNALAWWQTLLDQSLVKCLSADNFMHCGRCRHHVCDWMQYP